MVREVPNLLTVLRLLAVPVMVACLLVDNGAQERWRWIAWLVFVLAAATDALDGYLARRWEVVSAFGKLADPLADKALVLGALVMLAVGGETPWWPLIVVAIREASVTIGRLAVARDVVIPASAGGKLKTALQVLAISMLLLPVQTTWVDAVGLWVLYASVVVAVATGVDYAWRIGRIAMRHRVFPVADTADAMGEGGHVA
ncbi:CDP-diacylglycerol--glycerol-3-phosphate 3-phosphatidyltransferase [Demequina lutea]|uniref:CDP-diacylglycerol--glycerol-3-phosphate 3-phosphatidyltransferase n=1 Tax=Demequina lutea TaxID=431489 RepID=A0A7Y9ZD78_9MICO|nr:CDP-diacylglycerol--glycerol-3-phosphate 3-phosphatidyltransferase [Demequina lutea]NYI41800.1 CDP-diacylglycerol--glycerol-3-phosphate 3-phosphatidyltransferase [Demequina lutea]